MQCPEFLLNPILVIPVQFDNLPQECQASQIWGQITAPKSQKARQNAHLMLGSGIRCLMLRAKNMCKTLFHQADITKSVTNKGESSTWVIHSLFEKIKQCWTAIRSWKALALQWFRGSVALFLSQICDLCSWRQIRNTFQIACVGEHACKQWYYRQASVPQPSDNFWSLEDEKQYHENYKTLTRVDPFISARSG